MAKEDENANARPSRIVTRSKPPSTSSTTVTGVSTRSSALADANAQNKRKREALGEVTGKAVNNRVKATLDPKGKGKESVAIKPTKPPATATVGTTSRVPLRPVPARSKTNNAPQVKIKSDAIVLEPTAKAVPVVEIPVHPNPARRAPFRSTTSTNIASTTVTTNRRVTQKKVRSVYLDRDLAPINEEPLTKKRRTSSEAPEEVVEEDSDALAENVQPESTAVPSAETQDWDDLDREDDDDPLMVSEYVVDIFNYLKLLEVSIPLPSVRDGYINP